MIQKTYRTSISKDDLISDCTRETIGGMAECI